MKEISIHENGAYIIYNSMKYVPEDSSTKKPCPYSVMIRRKGVVDSEGDYNWEIHVANDPCKPEWVHGERTRSGLAYIVSYVFRVFGYQVSPEDIKELYL